MENTQGGGAGEGGAGRYKKNMKKKRCKMWQLHVYMKCGQRSKKGREWEKERGFLLFLFFFFKFRIHLNHQVNMNSCLLRMLYMYLRVTINPNLMTDTKK